MEINIAGKRLWARQRKIEADEIKRERKLVSEMDEYYRSRQENKEWDAITVGVCFGLALLIIFASTIQPVINMVKSVLQ